MNFTTNLQITSGWKPIASANDLGRKEIPNWEDEIAKWCFRWCKCKQKLLINSRQTVATEMGHSTAQMAL